MKLAIMQPYFLPYIGYFALIKHSDQFILFDTPQFIRHGWIERNRILKANGEPLYIKVPLVKHHRNTRINEIQVKDAENWKEKILAQLTPYKKAAPNYNKITDLINKGFNLEYESNIVRLNYNLLRLVCEYLEIYTPINIWSQMNINIEEVNSPDEWALNISKALKASTYYNPIGGTSFFDRNKYRKANIELKFIKTIPTHYRQISKTFVPSLSIIDVMMFCNKQEIGEMLDNISYIG